MSELISGRLRRWVAERGGSPLVTYYDLGTGERTELSGVSMANWVDKTSNLLADELGVEPGDQVDLAVAERNPGHWVTLVWQLACWQVGAAVTVGHERAATVQVVGQQIARLVHPVDHADPGQLGALAGRQVVVGEQRRRSAHPDPPAQPASDQLSHRGGDLTDLARRYPWAPCATY